LKTQLKGFQTGKLVWVKSLSNKYQKSQILKASNCTAGQTETGFCNEAKAWGQNHLWLECRKGFKLSGLDEPRISVVNDGECQLGDTRFLCCCTPMRVIVRLDISDAHLDANQSKSQRQLSISLAVEETMLSSGSSSLPLNLCLILDRSGSMQGRPIETVKQAASRLIEKLSPDDCLSVITFNHQVQVLIPQQSVSEIEPILDKIQQLEANGGTLIDEAMKLGIREAAAGKQNRISQIFLLTDGENEHGDDRRCLKLAQLASEYGITINTLGFGHYWNQDILEEIADRAGGTLCYIEEPKQASIEFSRLFTRVQSVGLTNAHLVLELMPQVRLAEVKPIAQVAPETIELTPQMEKNQWVIRLGDLLIGQEKIILVNVYLEQLPPGTHTIARFKVCYDDPSLLQTDLASNIIPVTVDSQVLYQPQLNDRVRQSILTLAKYRQTQLAEAKLKEGDRTGAATLLQSAANTALQLGEERAATVLQNNATRLQLGEELSEADRKKTRIVSKTRLQVDE
jgi:Ca-activated chloride channel family protein